MSSVIASPSATITSSRGAELTGDFNPLHVDEDFARASRFGSRILHGVITSALMGAPVGMYFHGTAIAYLEHGATFLAPVRVGDSLEIVWRVIALEAKPAAGGGIVTLEGDCANQDGTAVARARGRMLVYARDNARASVEPISATSSGPR